MKPHVAKSITESIIAILHTILGIYHCWSLNIITCCHESFSVLWYCFNIPVPIGLQHPGWQRRLVFKALEKLATSVQSATPVKAAINIHLCMPGVLMHSSQVSWKSLESMCSPGQVLYRELWHLSLCSWLTDRNCIASWEGGPGRASPTQHGEGHQDLLHRAVQELPRSCTSPWDLAQAGGSHTHSRIASHVWGRKTQPSVAGSLVLMFALIRILFKRFSDTVLLFTCNCLHQNYPCRSL